MAGEQKIKNYDGAYMGIKYPQYKHDFVTSGFAAQAWEWVASRSWPNNYTYNDETIDMSSGWVPRLLERMGMDKNQRTIGVDDSKEQCGKAEYSVAGRWMKIIISRWCNSLGVMRAMVMHEFMEVFAGITKFGRTAHGYCLDAHNYACNIVDQFLFEEDRQRIQRQLNFVNCRLELEKKCAKMKEESGGIPPIWDKLYNERRELANKMKRTEEQGQPFIPGYFEAYKAKGYTDPTYSSISLLVGPFSGSGAGGGW